VADEEIIRPEWLLRNQQYPDAQREGFRGDYIDWLEAELLDLRRRHDQLVDSVELLGPHLAAGVLSAVKQGKL
jgi:hypothetical protein